jgi:hypothetical protein
MCGAQLDLFASIEPRLLLQTPTQGWAQLPPFTVAHYWPVPRPGAAVRLAVCGALSLRRIETVALARATQTNLCPQCAAQTAGSTLVGDLGS